MGVLVRCPHTFGPIVYLTGKYLRIDEENKLGINQDETKLEWNQIQMIQSEAAMASRDTQANRQELMITKRSWLTNWLEKLG